MGADATWVCHTCKTVCARGGTPIFSHNVDGIIAGSIAYYKDILSKFCSNFEFDDREGYMMFLNDLKAWLTRHEGHSIHVGSDYSTDGMDLDDYRNETVGGEVSRMSRHEVNMACFSEWQENSIRDIESAVEECVQGGRKPREVAEEIFNRFSMRGL